MDDGPAAGWTWPRGRDDRLELGPDQLLVGNQQVEERVQVPARGRVKVCGTT